MQLANHGNQWNFNHTNRFSVDSNAWKESSGAAGAFHIFLVNIGACFSGSEYPSTLVYTITFHDCPFSEMYIEKQMQVCSPGEKDGKWIIASSYCISVILMLLFVLLGTVMASFHIMFCHKATKGTNDPSSSLEQQTEKEALLPVRMYWLETFEWKMIHLFI